jgi:hypothetical protein
MLITLRDAALCITKLPKAEHDADEWQAAMEVLMRIAEPERPPDLYIRSRAVAVPPISARSLKAIMTDKLTKKGQVAKTNFDQFWRGYNRRTSRVEFHVRLAASPHCNINPAFGLPETFHRYAKIFGCDFVGDRADICKLAILKLWGLRATEVPRLRGLSDPRATSRRQRQAHVPML